jgi:hypothetical protein
MSVTASRRLADKLCFEYGIPLLRLHDFDISGFSIAGTLERDTRRYKFENKIDVRNVGLRLMDVEGLESEPVAPLKEKTQEQTKETLRLNGATEDEIEILVDRCRRIEINAFTSNQLVAFIERKLEELGVKKVIPDDATLAAAYRRAAEQGAIQKMIDEAMASFREKLTTVDVPEDLGAQIEAKLADQPARSWDSVLRDIVEREAA